MRKWEDTVMSFGEVDDIVFKLTAEQCKYPQRYMEVAKAQAEISFNVGKQYGFEVGLEQGEANGRREVVKCLVNDFHFSPAPGCEHDRMWQAKLKGWGIKLP